MTAEKLIAAVDALKPNAYTMEQKTAWIDDMEQSLWQEVFLCCCDGQEQSAAGQRRLLLPESCKRMYVLYLSAMIDFYNAEYTRYSNAMTAYNSALQDFTARYAERYAPADRPAYWADLGTVTYNIAGAGRCVAVLPEGAAVLAAETVVTTAFNAAANTLCLGTARRPEGLLSGVNTVAEIAGRYLRRCLFVPEKGDNSLYAAYSCSGTATAGAAAFRVLIQPGKEG